MKIDVLNPDIHFAAFYILSFAVVLGVSVRFAGNRHLPLRSVLLMLTATTLFTVAGSRLFTVPLSEWHHLLFSDGFKAESGRSAIGGILFGFAGFIISSKYAGLDKQVLEFYAWLTPLGYGIQKIGCFLNGCCYGIPSDSIPGISYPRGTSAHFDHFIRGLIEADAAYSLKVFPVQLLETLVYILIAFVVWKTSGKWKKNGSIILFAFTLMFLFRYSTSFLRDPSSSQINIEVLRWFMLVTGTACGVILILYEKIPSVEIRLWSSSELTINRSIIFILAISSGMYLFHGIFSSYEKISLYITFLPSVILTGYFVLLSLKGIKIRFAATSFLILPLFMIYPTMSNDTLKKRGDYYQKELKEYKKIDAGISTGKFYSTLHYNPHEGECGTTYTREDYEYASTFAGGGYSVVSNKGTYLITKGINAFAGNINEINLTKDLYKSYFTAGLNPYIKYDRKWIGAGVGLNIGNMRWIIQKYLDEITFDHNTRLSPVMPEVSLRAGRKDIFDLRYQYGMNSYATFPVLMHEISIGSGFGKRTDFGLRYGAAVSEVNSFNFLTGEFLINKEIGMNLRYNFRTYSEHFNSPDLEPVRSKGIFVVGANIRFGSVK